MRRQHLPATATLSDYEAIIQAVIQHEMAHVYLFWYNQIPYVTLVTDVNERSWLVMFAVNGLLESADIVERPERYLNKPEFEYVDRLSNLLPKVSSDHDD